MTENRADVTRNSRSMNHNLESLLTQCIAELRQVNTQKNCEATIDEQTVAELQQMNAALQAQLHDRTVQLQEAQHALRHEILERQRLETVLQTDEQQVNYPQPTVMQVQEQERLLRSIYDGSASLIFVADVVNGTFRMVGCNAAAEHTIGINSVAIADKSPEEIFGIAQGTTIRARYTACVEAGHPMTYEECIAFQGQTMWWLTTYNPLKDGTGKIHRIVSSSINITEHRQVEEVLKDQLRLTAFRAEVDAFLTQGKDLQQMLHQCTDAIVGHLNAAFARIWLLNPEENVLELQASSGLYTHLDGAHARVPVGQFKIGLIAEEGKPHLTNAVLEDPRVGDKDWARREGMVAFAGYPLMVEGQILGVVALFARHPLAPSTLDSLAFVAQEIALGIKRKQTELALRHSEIQLREKAEQITQTLHKLQQTQTQLVQSEKMSSLGQLVAGIAHEINNPVNFIYGNLNHAHEYIQDLLRLLRLYQHCYPDTLPEIQTEAEAIDLDFLIDDLPKLLSSMKIGADRIQNIVRSLRNFSRMDEAAMKAVNIHDGINSTLMILQNRLKARSDRPEIKTILAYGDLPLVECYAGQLNQVFMNILANAIDALEEAYQAETITTPTITIHTAVNLENQLVIRIVDNGPGIPESIRQHLFEPFFTTKPVGQGTGMGLSISYQIVVEKHGGSLECVTSPEQGTEFVIQIPCQQSLHSS